MTFVLWQIKIKLWKEHLTKFSKTLSHGIHSLLSLPVVTTYQKKNSISRRKYMRWPENCSMLHLPFKEGKVYFRPSTELSKAHLPTSPSLTPKSCTTGLAPAYITFSKHHLLFVCSSHNSHSSNIQMPNSWDVVRLHRQALHPFHTWYENVLDPLLALLLSVQTCL